MERKRETAREIWRERSSRQGVAQEKLFPQNTD